MLCTVGARPLLQAVRTHAGAAISADLTKEDVFQLGRGDRAKKQEVWKRMFRQRGGKRHSQELPLRFERMRGSTKVAAEVREQFRTKVDEKLEEVFGFQDGGECAGGHGGLGGANRRVWASRRRSRRRDRSYYAALAEEFEASRRRRVYHGVHKTSTDYMDTCPVGARLPMTRCTVPTLDSVYLVRFRRRRSSWDKLKIARRRHGTSARRSTRTPQGSSRRCRWRFCGVRLRQGPGPGPICNYYDSEYAAWLACMYHARTGSSRLQLANFFPSQSLRWAKGRGNERVDRAADRGAEGQAQVHGQRGLAEVREVRDDEGESRGGQFPLTGASELPTCAATTVALRVVAEPVLRRGKPRCQGASFTEADIDVVVRQWIVAADLSERVRVKKTTSEEVPLRAWMDYEKRELAKLKNVATKRYVEQIVGGTSSRRWSNTTSTSSSGCMPCDISLGRSRAVSLATIPVSANPCAHCGTLCTTPRGASVHAHSCKQRRQLAKFQSMCIAGILC